MSENFEQFNHILKQFERRYRLRNGCDLLQMTLWMGLLGVLLIHVVGRYQPIARLWIWTLLPLVLWIVVMPLWAFLKPTTLLQIARRLDRELKLKERLSTAVLLNQHSQPDIFREEAKSASRAALIALQQQDAVETIRVLNPAVVLPLRWQHRSLSWAGAVALIISVLLYLPNPMDQVLAERAAVAEAVEAQAEQIEALRKEVEESQALSPEEREKLLNELEKLADQLRVDPQDREEALARLSEMEEKLRRQLDPERVAKQEMLQALSAQLQTLAKRENSSTDASLEESLDALDQLAEMFQDMDEEEQAELAQALAQLASSAAQAGDSSLAQALAAMSQSAQMGDAATLAESGQAVAQSLAESAQAADQQAQLQETLEQLQQSRQAVAHAGQGQGQGLAQNQGQGQNQGGRGGNSPGSGGGTRADQLPASTGRGSPQRLTGQDMGSMMGDLGEQVYVPWERRTDTGEESFIVGQETGQGETQIRQQRNPLPGADSTTLIPYREVYADYVDTANQTIERSTIPPGLKEYVRDYFIQLEP